MTTALYRRYRPDTFEDVIGQDHVTVPLRTALQKNRVNHAYLFSGPRGCGKTTSARILARCLNCEQGPTPTPCGTCPSCLDLATGGPGSLDVIEIDAASHGGVDDARDLRERATFAPARDRYKIFIIDEAHMVTSAGFNALLKIVEEPPEHIKFIFATTEPEKVIGTIRSRTHHYPFRLVPPEPMIAYAQKLCDEEHVQVAPGVLPLVVRAGGGSVRDTLSVLDQLMAGAGQDGMSYDLAVSLLGYTHGELLDDVVDALAARDAATVFGAVDRVIQSGLDPRRFVEDLLERFRDLIVVRAVPDATTVLHGIPQDQVERMATQAAPLGPSELSRWGDVTNTALSEMTGATSPRLHLELLCARLLLPSADDSERGLASRVDRIERNLRFGGAPVEAGSVVPDDAGPASAAGVPAGVGAVGAGSPGVVAQPGSDQPGADQAGAVQAPPTPGWGTGPSGAAAARQALRAARGEQASTQQTASPSAPAPTAEAGGQPPVQAPAADSPAAAPSGSSDTGSTTASPAPAADAPESPRAEGSPSSAPAAPRPAAPRPSVPNLPSMPGMVSASTLPTPPPKPHPTDDPVPEGPVDLDALEAEARRRAEGAGESERHPGGVPSERSGAQADVQLPEQSPAQSVAQDPSQQRDARDAAGVVADFVPTAEELAAAEDDDEFEPAELADDDPEVIAAREAQTQGAPVTETSEQGTPPQPAASPSNQAGDAQHHGAQSPETPAQPSAAPRPDAAPQSEGSTQPQSDGPMQPRPDAASQPDGSAQPTPEPQAHQGAPTAATSPEPGQVPHPQGGSGSVEMFRRAWPQIMDHLKNARRFVWSMVEPHVSVAGFDGQTLVLSFSHPGPMRAFRSRPDAMQLLRASIQDVLGVSPEIDVTEGGQGPVPGRGEPGPKAEGRTTPAAPTPPATPAVEPAAEASSPVAPLPSARATIERPTEASAAAAASSAPSAVSAPSAQSAPSTDSAPSPRTASSADSPSPLPGSGPSASSPAPTGTAIPSASDASPVSTPSSRSAASTASAGGSSSAPREPARSADVTEPAPATAAAGPMFRGRPIDPSLIVDLEEPWDEDEYGPEPEDPSYALAPSRTSHQPQRFSDAAVTPRTPQHAQESQQRTASSAQTPNTAGGSGAGQAPAAPRPGAERVGPTSGNAPAAPQPHIAAGDAPDEAPAAPRPGRTGLDSPAAPRPGRGPTPPTAGDVPAAPKPGTATAATPATTPDEAPAAPRPGTMPSGTGQPAPSGGTPAAPVPGSTKGWNTPPQSGWAPAPAQEEPTQAAPAAPQGNQGKLSRYQRLMAQAKSSEQAWGAPGHPGPAAPTAPAEPEDFVPSDDDEELESSTTFGRQAFERLLDATLIEELDNNGQAVGRN